jgi:hypothetical protein
MGNSPVVLDFSKAQPIDAGVTLDFSKAQPLNRTPQTTNSLMALAMSGQQAQMSPTNRAQFEQGRLAGTAAAAGTAAFGTLGSLLGAPSMSTTSVGTGILDATGQEIMKDVTQYGPSVARQVLSHPLAQKLLLHAAGLGAGGAILKAIFGGNQK